MQFAGNWSVRVSILLVAGFAVFALPACSQKSPPEPDETVILIAQPTAVETVAGVSVTSTTVALTPTAIMIESEETPVAGETAVPVIETLTPVQPVEIPDVDLPLHSVSEISIGSCRLTGAVGAIGLSGEGTAPAPTPTALPTDQTRPLSVLYSEYETANSQLPPIVGALQTFNESFQSNWVFANTVEEQAGQLHVFGARLSQLCSAISQVDVPPELLNEVSGLADAIRARHTWVSKAVDSVVCCDDAKNDFLATGFGSTYEIVRFTANNIGAEIEKVLGPVADSESALFDNEQLGLTIAVDVPAILVRNSIDILVVVPELSEVLDPISLGSDTQNTGSNIRIRRIRNRESLSSLQAVYEYEGLLTRFGPPTISGDDLVRDVGEVTLTYPLVENWSGSVSVFVLGEFTYFAELTCNLNDALACDNGLKILHSIKLLN